MNSDSLELSENTGEAGRRIDCYRVIRSLGSGGMAQVLLVEDTRIHRLSALKLHHPRLLDESTVLRFKREYRSLSRLRHPSVVRVHDYGVFERLPYMVMDYVQGESITSYVENKTPVVQSLERAQLVARLSLQVAGALEHVHSCGIVHRDLKPDNIMVSEDGQVTIIDFGVAKSSDESMEITESGVVLGTLAYASPEQVSGRIVDARSDLYSLGIIIYELLAGHRPFVAEHVATYILKHVTEAPIPIGQFNSVAPDFLVAICDQLLKKQPVERYRNAGHLADKLSSALRKMGDQAIEQTSIHESTQSSLLFEPAFAGRRRERQELLADLQGLVSGRGGVVFLTGVAGMGKSRLLQELRGETRTKGMRVLRTQFHGHHGEPYQGIGEVLGHLVGQLARGAKGPHLSAHTLAAFPQLAQFVPAAPAKSRLADEAEAHRAIIEDILGVLKQAVKSPLVVTVEQAHLADARSVRLITEVIDASLTSHSHIGPILWVLSFQSDEIVHGHPLQAYVFRNPPVGRLVQLSSLDREDVRVVVASMLGQQTRDLTLADKLFDVSEGNPLFLTETIHQLVDSGYLTSAEDDFGPVWAMNPEVRLPTSLTEILRYRVDGLTEDYIELVEICSVLGGAFSAPLMVRMLKLGEAELLDFVQLMLQKRFLVERQGAGGVQYRFLHPRLRQLLYRTLPRERQVELHLRAAKALIEGEEEASIEIIAAHYFAAGEFASAAMTLLERSTELIAGGASLEALRLLKRADECLIAGGTDIPQKVRFGVAVKLGTAMGNLGEVNEGMAQFKLAYGISKVMDEPGWRGQTLYLIGRLYQQIGDYRRSSRYYYRGMRLCSEAGDHAMMLRSLNGLAGVLWRLGDDRRASRLFDEVLQLSRRIGSIMAEAAALNGLGLLAVHKGDFGRSVRLFTTSRDLHERSERRAVSLLVELNIASSERVLGLLGPSRRRAQSATQELERLGHHLTAANGWLLEAELALDMGELNSVEPALQQSAQLGSEQSLHQVGLQTVRGRLLATKGSVIDGVHVLSQALATSRQIDMADFTGPLLVMVANYQIQLGSSADAQSLLKEALDLALLRKRPVERANVHQVLALAHLRRGERAAALLAIEEALALHSDSEMRLEVFKDSLLLAELYLLDEGVRAAQGVLKDLMVTVGEIREGLNEGERQAFAGKAEVARLAKLWRSAGLGIAL